MSTSTASAYTSDTHFRAAARRGQHGVRLPRRWRDVLDARELTMLAVLHSMRSSGSRFVTVGQRTIAAKLGRDPETRTDHVGRAAARLEQAGAISTTRTGRGTGITRYELLDQRGSYDVIPWPLLRALEAGECGPGEVRTYAYLADAMGAYGRTSDRAAELAGRVGTHARTVRRHVARLELLGLVQILTVPSDPGAWLIRRLDEGDATEVHSGSITPETTTTENAPAPEPEVVETPAGGPDTDVGSVDTDVGSYEDLAPGVLAPDSLSPSRSDRYPGERARCGLRPKGGVYAHPGCPEVLAELSGTAWRAAGHARWLGGVLSKAVVPALEAGMTPAAIGWALIDHGEDELLERPTSHIPIARQAIAEVSLDIRLGHACRLCGALDGVFDGIHPECTPTTDHTETTTTTTEDGMGIPLEERLATYRQLQMTTSQVAEIDPEAATRMGEAA